MTAGPFLPPLEDLLASLETRAHAVAVCRVAHGWSLMLDGLEAPLIGYVLKGGGAIVHVTDHPPLKVCTNDLVILPRGMPHRIDVANGHARLRQVNGFESCTALAEGILGAAAGADTAPGFVALCGKVEATVGGSIGLFDRLQRPAVVALGQNNALRRAFEAVIAELSSPTFGSRALTEALLKQCIILFVRKLLAGDARDHAWLVEMVDRRLAGAMTRMIEHPGCRFSLAALADSAGMSRSSFAAQFARAAGEPPMEFLRRLRLRAAAHLLKSTRLPVRAIARTVGFGSRTYFSRAFRAAYGADPRAFRAKVASPTPAPARAERLSSELPLGARDPFPRKLRTNKNKKGLKTAPRPMSGA